MSTPTHTETITRGARIRRWLTAFDAAVHDTPADALRRRVAALEARLRDLEATIPAEADKPR